MFPLVISERWQQEVAETVFDTVNQEADKIELKRKAKHKHKFDTDEKGSQNFRFSFYFFVLLLRFILWV